MNEIRLEMMEQLKLYSHYTITMGIYTKMCQNVYCICQTIGRTSVQSHVPIKEIIDYSIIHPAHVTLLKVGDKSSYAESTIDLY